MWLFSRNDRQQGNVEGISLAAYVSRLYSLKGVNFALFNGIDHQKGLSIGVYNRSANLKGVQVGLWNIAENKRRFKQMPFFNFNFRRS